MRFVFSRRATRGMLGTMLGISIFLSIAINVTHMKKSTTQTLADDVQMKRFLMGLPSSSVSGSGSGGGGGGGGGGNSNDKNRTNDTKYMKRVKRNNAPEMKNEMWRIQLPVNHSSPQIQRMIQEEQEQRQKKKKYDAFNDNKDDKSSSLKRSIQHQTRFEQRKDTILAEFPYSKLFWADVRKDGVNLLNDEYGALHVFKSGGSTVAAQTGIWDIGTMHPESQRRKWVTFVRDPIDHFLSGWAECGHRYNSYRPKKPITDDRQIPPPLDINDGFVKRIKGYLWKTRRFSLLWQSWACEMHSFPQVNFMISHQQNRQIYRQLQYVGDLKEMPSVLNLANFEFNHTIPTVRTAEGSWYKRQYFYSDIKSFKEKEIPDHLMIEICKFVAIDYYLFDFEPPKACQGTVFHPNGTLVPEAMAAERNITLTRSGGGGGGGGGPRQRGGGGGGGRHENGDIYNGRAYWWSPPQEDISTLEERIAILERVKKRSQANHPSRYQNIRSSDEPVDSGTAATTTTTQRQRQDQTYANNTTSVSENRQQQQQQQRQQQPKRLKALTSEERIAEAKRNREMKKQQEKR